MRSMIDVTFMYNGFHVIFISDVFLLILQLCTLLYINKLIVSVIFKTQKKKEIN